MAGDICGRLIVQVADVIGKLNLDAVGGREKMSVAASHEMDPARTAGEPKKQLFLPRESRNLDFELFRKPTHARYRSPTNHT